MSLDPLDLHLWSLLSMFKRLLDEFEIGDRACRLLRPSLRLPTGRPFGQNVDDKLGVGVNTDFLVRGTILRPTIIAESSIRLLVV